MKAVQVAGRLGRPIELRVTPNGSEVCSFDLAVDGYDFAKKEKKSDWFSCTVFGKSASFLERNAIPGDTIAISGELEIESWQSGKFHDQDGNPANMKKVTIKANLNGVELFWTGKRDRTDSPAERPSPSQGSPVTPANEHKDVMTDFNEDDIPF